VEFAGRFEAEVARVLRALPNTAVTVTPKAGDEPDVVIRVGGCEAPVIIEAKRYVNAATARQLAHTQTGRDLPVIVVAESTTADAREVLVQHGIGLIDGLGNAHLELPGLLLHVAEPGAHARGAPRPTRLTGKAGVVAQAMLLDQDASWHVQDLADAASVSPALAHRVLARLDAENLTEIAGAGPRRTRRLNDPSALLDLWAEEMTDRRVHRHNMFRLARSADRLLTETAAALHDAQIDYAATGAGVAARIAPFITAVPITEIWITAIADAPAVAAAIDAEPVTTGHNLVLRQAEHDTPLAFRRDQDGLTIVNPFRLYYDLRQDPRRGREQADRLRQEVLVL
jgi:hypothetical protein